MTLEECTLTVTNSVVKLLNLNAEVNINNSLDYYGLDSMRTIKLIVDLEETFNIVYTDEELLFENFISSAVIAEKIMSKLYKIA